MTHPTVRELKARRQTYDRRGERYVPVVAFGSLTWYEPSDIKQWGKHYHRMAELATERMERWTHYPIPQDETR